MSATQFGSDPMRWAVLGDSVAFGQGANDPRDTLAERLTRVIAVALLPEVLAALTCRPLASRGTI